LRLRTGRPSTLPSPEEAAAYPYTAADRALIASATASHVVGDPATVIAELDRLAALTGVDELMVTTSTFGHAERLRSYELLAEQAARPLGRLPARRA
jgi:alkanesulfonate monooxygenase SsuD/methylene tetrahydromethanopterin reductase-like flavin-dependent oxidoreductase (luciferase family)